MKKKIIISFILTLMIVLNGMSTFAAVSNKSITIQADQVWSISLSDKRSTNYSHVSAGCDTVYPFSGSDNFSKIQTRVVNSSGTVISTQSYTVLQEGSGMKNISLKEGYLGLSTVYFQFRGNSSSSAKAIVDYDGL